MEKVVYVLGAGFSAPLGLPVSRDFIRMAKDMFASFPGTYEHFGPVFERLDQMARIKHYFASDHFNIEEVLSILEMERQVATAEEGPEAFIRFICDVVENYTPSTDVRADLLQGNPARWAFGTGNWNAYGQFVSHVLGMRPAVHQRVDPPGPSFVRAERIRDPKARYAILTLNYDTVLESMANKVRSFVGGEPMPGFRIRPGPETGVDGPWLVKLHGSVAGRFVVPPTWNKSLHGNILPAWREAHRLLREANQIRFIGYSLPEADAYVRYLLKSAVMKAQHLKQIDVVCLADRDADVRRRYDQFIDLNYYRFHPTADSLWYLQRVTRGLDDRAQWDLEDLHEAVFATVPSGKVA